MLVVGCFFSSPFPMNLARFPHDPSALVDFYQEALEHLGAVCERSWFDRLQLVAEGRAARLWNAEGALHDTELHFPAPDTTAPRDADRDVFPGCPLTFRLGETLLPGDLVLERAVLSAAERNQPPTADVAEKLWRVQWPGDSRWRMESAFAPAHHCSLLALVRCEIQAIDQHWSLHRLALTLPGGERDESLAAALDFTSLVSEPPATIAWPPVAPTRLRELLSRALTEELAGELASIRVRQEKYLRREVERIDDYFAGYAQELQQRAARSHSENSKLKITERLAAAQAEHARRRQDQIQRHEIRVLPRFDALLLLAEPAWQAKVTVSHRGEARSQLARFVSRARRWFPVE
jgi:hypothetical protein